MPHVCVCDCQVHAVSFGIFISVVLVTRGIGDEGRAGEVTPRVSPRRLSATTCAPQYQNLYDVVAIIIFT